MNTSLNHRELTYKALAGLAGGAIGWLPVELASHGKNLTDAMSGLATSCSRISRWPSCRG